MKHLGIIALGMAVAIAMLASAVNASATIVTADGTTFTGPEFKGSNESGHIRLHNPAANIECQSSFAGTIQQHGQSVTAESALSSLTFTGCTGGWTVTVNWPGVLIAHTTSGNNATLTWIGGTISATNDALGITCRYAAPTGADIGTVTSSTSTGSTATIDVSGSLPFHGGSIFCGSGASAWTGAYLVTAPDNLKFD